jgi:lipopolysaccharide transport system ATP-binding protein
MQPILSIRGLSKSYLISHKQGFKRYVALRDVISDLWKKRSNSQNTRQSREIFWALDNVSFDVNPSERIGIIGRNGAGKSTLLKLISRITEPTNGRIELRGRVASLLEVGTGFHPELTGRENIFLNGSILGMSSKEIRKKFDEIVAFAEVDKFLDTPVKRYSSGMYVRLAFSVAAHLEPEILLVDEVLAVGDTQFQKKCMGKMEDVAKNEGRTILFVSHNMAAIQNLCEKSILLDAGKIKRMDNTPAVINTYLSQEKTESISLKSRTDRTGNGHIRFTGIDFSNASNEKIVSAQSGDPLHMNIAYERNSIQDCHNVVVELGIDTITGVRIAHLSNKSTGQTFPQIKEKEGNISIDIPRLPLIEGRYVFTLFCTVNGALSDWIRNAFSLDVVAGDFYGTGKLPPHGQGNFLIDYSFSIS